jgi:D-mannonate dehydratase
MTDDAMLEQVGDKLYATARAYIVDRPEDLPREMASELKREDMNPGFLWIAGRYVQANSPNRNGHYWTLDDLQKGEQSIRYTPMNILHKWDRPVGTLVETKIVHREDRVEASDRLLPEIQALGVLWAHNFPQLAKATRDAHEAKKLWYSMECVAESKQCLKCEQIFPFRAQAHEVCEHMATSAVSPRRFINPIFMGGALIFPPARPGWKDADVTEVAQELVRQYAEREVSDLDAEEWEHLMALVVK